MAAAKPALLGGQDNPSPLVRLARTLARQGRADEAEVVLERVVPHAAAPAASAESRELARLLQAQRRYREAEDRWREIRLAVPGDASALQGLLRVVRLRHRFVDA